MEKKKAIRVIKPILAFFYFLVFIGLLLLQVWLRLSGSGISMESLIYWWILIGWVLAIINFKWKSSVSLVPAFLFFAFGAALVTVGLDGIAEKVMRISFLGWMVGIVQALVEYRKHVASKASNK